jgi:DDE superfamily endonuclease
MYPVRHATVREMAEAIRQQRVNKINEDAIELVSYPELGKLWSTRFLKRHPYLYTVRGRSIEASRVRESSPSILNGWFGGYKQVFDDLQPEPENIYNMGETGFFIGTMRSSNIIIDKNTCSELQASPGRQEWISVVECISMDGREIPPLIIFKGTTLCDSWWPDDVDEAWKLSCQPNGWSSNHHGLEWFIRCFEPATRAIANGGQKPRILIFDGHDSHVTSPFLLHSLEHNIHLLMLPAHTSHLLQPLDVGVFGPLKGAMSKCLDRLIRSGITRLQKVEWVEMYMEARPLAFTKSNIEGTWRGAGLFPYSPQKVLRKLPDPPTPTRPSTPPNTVPLSITPFQNINSSPPDALNLRSADSSLNQLLIQGLPLDTPARTYVRRLANTAEVFQADLAITRTQYQELKTVVTKRVERATGKRKSLQGQASVSRIEYAEEWGKQEQARKERQKIKGNKRKPPGPSVEIQEQCPMPQTEQ